MSRRQPLALSPGSRRRARAPVLGAAVRARVQRRLLAWFRRQRRDLPWRHNRDPYRIWVSEIMLQQTQVATVVAYFERFLEAFPTLSDLADAREADVLRLWEGLGYYRRARDLHRAARIVKEQHGGCWPRDPHELRQLPGIGRYTAAAILSQAFDRKLPILEANSRRVLCRWFGQARDPRQAAAERWLWQAAEGLLPDRRVGDFNQALMELGALVCTPTAPDCSACPLSDDCCARRFRLQEQIPPRVVKPRTLQLRELALVVRRGRRVLLVQRPSHGRWAHLWEFPHGPLPDDEHGVADLLEQLTGMEARIGPELLTIRHSVTHHRITMVCRLANYRSGRFHSAFYQNAVWIEPEQLHAYPVSAPQRRLARALLES